MLTFGETHARATDPETSKAAARRAARFSASQAGRILLALQQHGPSSAKDLSPILGLTMEQIDRRLPDLKDEGLARVVLLSDGAELVREKCRVWEAVRP